tara:strand:+ start:19795 stop:20424 length:630 start_codon:yes stop_codon:yes gene_type:complete
MSISTVRHVSSSSGSENKAGQSLTPISAGGTGSVAVGQQIRREASELSVTLVNNDVANSQKLSRLSKLGETRFEYLTIPSDITPDWISEVEQEVEALLNQDNMEPLGIRGAAVYIEQLASVFQVSIPDQHGLEIYIKLLSDKPTGPAIRAQPVIVAGHRYKTLPLPAEIISAISDDPVMYRLSMLRRALRLIKLKIEHNTPTIRAPRPE